MYVQVCNIQGKPSVYVSLCVEKQKENEEQMFVSV